MARLREYLRRLWGTARPVRQDRDLEDELRSHLAMANEAMLKRHDSPQAAARAARVQTGGMDHALDALRDQRGMPALNDFGRDIRYGLRAWRRTPVFAAVAVLTLAIGIGANTAIFSLTDAVLLRPLPVSRPGDLVILRQRGPTGDIFPFTSAAAEDLARQRDVLSGLAAFRPLLNAHVTVDAETDFALAQLVSGNYHAMLGVGATLGRTLTEQDRDVAVISDRYWRRRFNGDPNVIGRTLEMQGRTFTIVGVTPPEFFGTQPGRLIDITAPLAAQTMAMPPRARWLYLLGRLEPGVSRERARAALGARWTQMGGGSARDPITLELDPGAQGLNELRREFSLPLRVLLLATGVVLLLACVNLAGLLMGRSTARQQEIGLRRALGASQGRIFRQLLAESALLAAVGGAAGVVASYAVTDLLVAMMSRGRMPIALDVAPNARTLAFAAAVTAITGVLFGLLPALVGSRTDLRASLNPPGPLGRFSRFGWGQVAVVVQVAILLVLLASAVLFGRSLYTLRSIDSGVRLEQILVVTVSRGPTSRGTSTRALSDDLLARFSVVPTVESVSVAMDTPFGGGLSMAAGVTIPGRPPDAEDAPPVYHNFVGPRFFETLRIPIARGREFDPADDERAAPCVVVSESVARRYFAGEDPLGRQVIVGGVPASIIGVARDVRYTSLRADAPLFIYRAYRQQADAPANTFVIRTSSARANVTPAVHAAIRAAAPTLPLPAVVSLEDQLAAVLVRERMLATLSMASAAFAVVLAIISIYSTVALSVARRRREFGIRLALGALPRQVVRMTLTESSAMVAAGVALGVLVWAAVGQIARGALGSVLFNLSPADPTSLVFSTVAVLLTAWLAGYVPAHRASRTNLVSVMRHE